MINQKGEKTHISNIRNEKRSITTDPITLKRMIKAYYEQLHHHKDKNLDEMDHFFERCNLLKLILRRNRQSE